MRAFKAALAAIAAMGLAPSAMAQSRQVDPVEQVRQDCAGNDRIASIYDCGCIVDRFKTAQARSPGEDWRSVYSNVYTSEESRACAQPDRVWIRSIRSCGTTYNQSRTLDRKNLGKASYCHCLSDERRAAVATVKPGMIVSLPLGHAAAVLKCGKLDSYAVPADSPFRPAAPRPVPALGKGLKLAASDRYIYLIVLNRNFDVGKLDNLRYAISDEYDTRRPNDAFVTEKANPVAGLPRALTSRGALHPGKIDARNDNDVAQVAFNYNHAILIHGSGLPKIQDKISRIKGVTSVDYYVVSGSELYAVPDLNARLVR